jgi:hypothetical protein
MKQAKRLEVRVSFCPNINAKTKDIARSGRKGRTFVGAMCIKGNEGGRVRREEG